MQDSATPTQQGHTHTHRNTLEHIDNVNSFGVLLPESWSHGVLEPSLAAASQLRAVVLGKQTNNENSMKEAGGDRGQRSDCGRGPRTKWKIHKMSLSLY